MAFTLSNTVTSVALLGGSGDIGTALMGQLKEAEERLAETNGVEIRVNVCTSSKNIVCGPDSRGLDLEKVPDMLANGDECEKFDLDRITALMEADVNPHRVIIDCTNNELVAEYYAKWLAMGVNIISPNRKVAAGSIENYQNVYKVQRESQAMWQYESSVGAALPILTTLEDLKETGDKINVIKGCVSGTMAYTLSKFSEEMPYSEAVARADEKNYPEADLREDLTGLDMARKVVILARRAGLQIELADVEVESLLPYDIMSRDYSSIPRNDLNKQLLKDIKVLDDDMLARLKEAEAKDCVLRYQFTIDIEKGTAKCSLEEVPRTDPLYRLKKNENLVAFETDRYITSPLIVKGAAAGPNLAAAGIFADLLRLTRAFSSLQI